MKRQWWWLGVAGAAAVVGAAVAWFVLSGGSGIGSFWARRAEAYVVPAAKTSEPSPEAPSPAAQGPVPKAVADVTTHDFGVLEPGESCDYDFTIRNEGEAPLLLERGGTSCTCTMSDLPQKEIPPGYAVKVNVSSKVELKEGPFANTARIFTNDPDRPAIEFTVQGKVLTILAADQPNTATYALRGEAPPPQEVLVYSAAWDSFQITDVQSSLPETTWTIEPADKGALKGLDARSGYFLTVQMPPQTKSGYHNLGIDLKASPASRPELEKSLHVGFVHHVKTGYSLSGDKLRWFDRTVEMGRAREGDGKTEALALTVRDPKELKVEKIESNPPFLKASLEPLGRSRKGVQLFRIKLEIPPDAPPCNFATESGWVRITTSSQAAKEIDLKVSFAVAPQF